MAVSISQVKQEILGQQQQTTAERKKEGYPVIEIIPRSTPPPFLQAGTVKSISGSVIITSASSAGQLPVPIPAEVNKGLMTSNISSTPPTSSAPAVSLTSSSSSAGMDLDLNTLKQEATSLDFLEDSSLPLIPTFAEAFMLSHLGCANVNDCLSKIDPSNDATGGSNHVGALINSIDPACKEVLGKMEANNNIKEELDDDVVSPEDDFPDNMDVDVDNWDQCFRGIEDILSKDIDLESLDIFSSTKMDTDLIKEEEGQSDIDIEEDSGLVDDDVEVEDSGINMDRDLDSEGNSRDSSQDTDGYSLSSGSSPPAPAERKLDISCLGLSTTAISSPSKVITTSSNNNGIIGLPTGILNSNTSNVLFKKQVNVMDGKMVNNLGVKSSPTLAYNIIPPLLQPLALPSPSAGPGGSLSLDKNREVVVNSQTAGQATLQANYTKFLQSNNNNSVKNVLKTSTEMSSVSTGTNFTSTSSGNKRIKLSFPLEKKLDLSCTCAKCRAERNGDKAVSHAAVELPSGAVVPTGTVTVTTSTGLKLPAAVQSYVITSSSSAMSTPSLLLPTSSAIASTGKTVLMSPSQRVNETVRALLSAAANQAMARQAAGESKQPTSATINNIMSASRAKVASLLSKHSLTTTIPLTTSAVTSTTPSSSAGLSPISVSASPSPPLITKVKEEDPQSHSSVSNTISSLRLKTKLAADSKKAVSGNDSTQSSSTPAVTVASGKKTASEGTTEPGLPDLTCVACTKTFSRRYNLRRHQMSLGHWAPISHPNPITFKSTRLDQNMPPNQAVAKREEIHDDEKPYVCEACSMRFTLKSSLRRHQIKFGHIAQPQVSQVQLQPQNQPQQTATTTLQQQQPSPNPPIIQPMISQQLQQPQVTPVITLKSPVSVQSLQNLPQLTVVSCSTPSPSAVSPDIPISTSAPVVSTAATAGSPATTISLMIIPCIKRKDGSSELPTTTTLNIGGRTIGVESVK